LQLIAEDSYMTTEKQIKANQANAKKSTGAISDEGKVVIATNALKHGLFAQRVILQDESLDEYAQLIDGLIGSLNPVGTLEKLLVEKIAVTTWKQLRLARAESASIELDRSMSIEKNRKVVGNTIGKKWDEPTITIEEFEPLSEHDEAQLIWCKDVIKESDTISYEILRQSNIVKLKTDAPNIYEQLSTEAESEDMSIDEYVAHLNAISDEGVYYWSLELNQWANKELARINRRGIVQAIGSQLKTKLTSPIHNELLSRYQAGIDNELYKAIEALRKQQEWRSKGMVILEAG
jgi:hypothetical protein